MKRFIITLLIMVVFLTGCDKNYEPISDENIPLTTGFNDRNELDYETIFSSVQNLVTERRHGLAAQILGAYHPGSGGFEQAYRLCPLQPCQTWPREECIRMAMVQFSQVCEGGVLS